MTLRPYVYAALALLIELVPAAGRAGSPPTILAPGIGVTPGQCGGATASPMCLEVPATSRVYLTCTAQKGRDGMLGVSSPVTAFRFAVSGGTLAASEVAVTPAAVQSTSVLWTTPGEGAATATCWAVGGSDVSTPSRASVSLVPPPPQPVVQALTGPTGAVLVGTTHPISVVAREPQGGALSYAWRVSGGTFTGQGTPSIVWTAPPVAGQVEIAVTITGESGGVAIELVRFAVAPSLFQGNLPTGMRAPRSVAATPSGELAVVDGAGQLWLLTRLGALRARPFVKEGAVAVAGAPGVFYVSTADGNVLKVDVASGRTVARYQLGFAQGPVGLAWDAGRGLLWMAHSLAGVVQAIRPDGSSALTISRAGTAELRNLAGVAVDAATGTVWASQAGNGDGAMVHAFQGDGTFLRSIATTSQVFQAGGVAAAGGKVYVSDAFAGRVQVLGEDGSVVGAVGAFGNDPGQLRQPAGMAFLANGDLLVASLDSGRLERFGTGASMVGCAGDTDCDGLSDAAEAAAGLDLNDAADALADADGDGLTNQEEVAYGTSWRKLDTDGDGISDRDELLAGFDPRDPNDHAASLTASAPARSAPGLIKVLGVAAGAGDCAVSWKQVDGPAVALQGATTASPSFVARSAGTYVLEGVASCGAGLKVRSAPARVAVAVTNLAPVAEAGRTVVVGPGELAELSGARSSDANGDKLAFAWEQTAGPAALLERKDAKLSVRPLAAGYHAFKLAARDGRGAAGQAEVPVILVEPPAVVPTAMAVSTVLTGQVGAPVTLEAIAPEATAFAWEQLSGPRVSGFDRAAVAPTFVPPAPGRYSFRLVAWNGQLRSAPETVQVYVAEAGAILPAAAAAAPAQVAVNAPVALDGSGSAAGNGGPLSYRWRQVAGPAAGLTEADRASATVVPFAPGWYEFELAVAEQGAVGVPVRVAFEALADGKPLPRAVARAQGTALVGELVLLDGAASTGAARYRWTQVAGPWVALKATLASPTFVPPAAGQYVFELEVDDGLVKSRPAAISVLVMGNAGN